MQARTVQMVQVDMSAAEMLVIGQILRESGNPVGADFYAVTEAAYQEINPAAAELAESEAGLARPARKGAKGQQW